MGKYMRKAKITGDGAVMEVVPQSSLGVRTRARTRLQSTNTTPPPPPQNPELAYLQLRNRRLEKVIPPLNDGRKQKSTGKDGCRKKPNPNPCGGENPRSRLGPKSVDAGSVRSVSISCSKNGEEDEAEDQNNLGNDASFGENNLEFEQLIERERSTRESTPCSLIRGPDTVGTPVSTTRQTASALTATNQRIQDALERNIPTTQEMEEFFALAEQQQQQQRLFTEKYNFDVGNDMPLRGRYDWVRVNH